VCKPKLVESEQKKGMFVKKGHMLFFIKEIETVDKNLGLDPRMTIITKDPQFLPYYYKA